MGSLVETIAVIAVIATVVAGWLSGQVAAAAQHDRLAQRELNRQVVAIFYSVSELRDHQLRFQHDQRGWFDFEAQRGVLGQLLREFAVVAAGLREAEKEKAMRVYRLLAQLSNHNLPKGEHDPIARLVDKLANQYPELLDELRRDDGEHEEFHALTATPQTRTAIASVAERKADAERDVAE